MNYIVLEIQTSNGTTTLLPPLVYEDRIEAEAVFLEKCAAARRSGLAVHTAVLMDNEGKQIAKKVFKT